MAGVAVHMMAVQDQLMAEMNQIQVQTLICSGTDDKLTAVSGNRALLLSFFSKEFIKFRSKCQFRFYHDR